MRTIRASIAVAVLIQCLNSWAGITNSASYYDLGVNSAGGGKWDKAVTEFSEAIGLNPTNALAFEYRGSCYFMQSELDKAISDYDQALRLNSRDTGAIWGLAAVYRAKGQADGSKDDIDRSIHYWNEYMQRNLTNDLAYKSRAADYNITGRYDEAIKDWSEGLRLNPKDSTAVAMRGVAYFKTSQFDKAEHDYTEAVRLGPTNDVALNSLAWFRATCPVASFRNGKEAVKASTKACELAKWTRWDWVDTLAAAFAEEGDFERAVIYEKQAMRLDGVSENDRKNMQRCLSLYERKQPNHEGQK